ncbi:tryptophan synthase subunit alpha [Undibacterium oligocarboniphilum]|uniref:Tryptophan synthase alpha chain n=1 Tax=Undibacterium oligocarboniphilum TaxID=666702 RepID=A0A850QFM4_9BURK|nr:tryptophan synthase subunit alpha [Undibacterium oligocarboniphilum]MBC3870117.1 tryptophan synthase subunit alpha [Undibacterium oligocarboniphilum]NVO78108.1 tryptophan synthase subunit alpha [Undibacterium oligocarboniphilum]
MSKIKSTLAALAAQNRKALIPFITAGDPAPAMTVPLMHALVDGGADIIELGVPFSDPMADGPVIQRASERALQFGVGLRDVLQFVREFRVNNSETPVVLMGYANPIERLGQQAFIRQAAEAGVDGVLVVDYPPEECEEFASAMQQHDMDTIFLLAPTSTDERMAQVGKIASGYVYYVSLKGVTGSGNLDLTAVADMIPRIRKHVNVPVGVGFGIRDGATARAISSVADGVVIGSRIIQELENTPPEQAVAAVKSFISGVRQALDE